MSPPATSIFLAAATVLVGCSRDPDGGNATPAELTSAPSLARYALGVGEGTCPPDVGTHATDDLVTTLARQHDVEHYRVEGIPDGGGEAVVSAVFDVDHETLGGQPATNRLREVDLVLDHQHAHRRVLLSPTPK
jgi:hypothetical protein